MAHKQTDVPISDSQRGYSLDGVWPGTVAGLSMGLMALIIFAMISTYFVLHWLYPGPPLTDAGAKWKIQNNIPGVEPNQAYGREEFAAEERAYLNEYAWQDKDRGMAKIPIQRGIEWMAAHDLNVQWPESQASGNADSNTREVAK